MSNKKHASYRKDSRNWDLDRAGRLKELKDKIKGRPRVMGGGIAETGEDGEKR